MIQAFHKLLHTLPRDLTVLIIEHDMDLIGRLCDPVIVMAQGEKIAEGPMAEIRANPAIVEAYFGTPVEAE